MLFCYYMVMEHKEKVSIVLSCIDYRFWPEALPLLEKKYGEFDLIELAGGSKNLSSPNTEADRKAVLESINVSVNLHKAKQIILTNHIDCGAYGGSKKFKNLEAETIFHVSELDKAREIINKWFPGLKVITVLINKNKEGKIYLLEEE